MREQNSVSSNRKFGHFHASNCRVNVLHYSTSAIKSFSRAFAVVVFFGALFFLNSCSEHSEFGGDVIEINTDSDFADYWYSGEAEITTYLLEQEQYGNNYQGVVTTIFVTEDFDIDKHVKADLKEVEGQELVTVMKLNMEKQFQTGIYPYKKMLSSFSPITGEFAGRSLKVTASALEWCGQTFNQWNRAPNGEWGLRSFSYFERQGDGHQQFEAAWMEDELWALIRLAPHKLPMDTFPIIPANFNLRDRVAKPDVYPAYANKVMVSDTTSRYDLYITGINRRLRIEFSSSFPHEILGWEEEFFRHGEKVTHTAERYKTTMIDYWNKNAPADTSFYKELMPPGIVP